MFLIYGIITADKEEEAKEIFKALIDKEINFYKNLKMDAEIIEIVDKKLEKFEPKIKFMRYCKKIK